MKRVMLIVFFAVGLIPNFVFAAGVGDSVPSVTLPTLANPNAKVNLATINSKYILIDFWASWCASCRVSMSTLSKLSKSLNSKGFKVVGICLDKDPALAKEFMKKYPSSFTQLSDPQGVTAGRFGLSKMPTSYLIGPDKKIIRVFPGYNEGNLNSIKELIK